jgi:hypothetical protein
MRKLLILILLLLPALAFNQTKIDSIDQATLSGTSKFPTIDGPDGAKRWKYFDGDQVREFSSADIIDRAYVPDSIGHAITNDYGNFIRSTVDNNRIYYCDYSGNCRPLTDTLSSGGGSTTIPGYGAKSRGDTLDIDTSTIANKNYVDNQISSSISGTASTDLNYRLVPVGTLNGRNIYAGGTVDPSEANLAMMQHAEDELIVPTFDGTQNIAHPSMEYIDTSWNGYKYWLAFTPYPAENRENPSIAYSNDGITWDTTGLSNPVVPPGDTAAGNYNSDVDLLFRADQSKMYLFWRYTDGSNDMFYGHTSTDGLTWSDSTSILTLSGSTWLSPTYQYIKDDWHTWYIDAADSSNSILYYRRADQLTGLSSATQQTCTYNYIPSGKHLWHIQVWNDPTEDQLCAIFNFTDIPGPGGAPNTQGTLHYATSTDGKTWDVQTSPMMVDLEGNSNSGKFENLVYRSTLRPTDYSEANGAAFEVIYNASWNLGRSMIWLQPRAAKTTQIADTISNINALYSFFVRDSSWYGLPVARVSVRDTLRDVFSDGIGGLQLADSTALETWAGSDTAKLVRWYNQKLVNDYLRFINYPDLLQNPWNGSTGKWYAAFDAADTIYAETMRGNLSVEGVTFVADIETGRPFSVKSGVSYFGMNSGKLYLLTGANVNTDIQPRPGVFSGIFGGSARIRKNGTNLKTGSTSSPSDTEYQAIGSFWGTSAYDHSQAFTGKISEVWMYNSDIGNTELSIIENQLNTDYAYQIDTLIYDTFTDDDATDLATGGHAPDQSPGDSTTWYQSSSGWTINSNKLQKTGAGDEFALIDAGSADGVLSFSVSNLTTELSGPVFRRQDAGNYWHVRVQGTTVYLYRVASGGFNTESSASVPDINGSYDVKIELNGSKIMVYIDGVLEITHTGTEYQTETVHGIRGSSADDNSFYDNFIFESW